MLGTGRLHKLVGASILLLLAGCTKAAPQDATSADPTPQAYVGQFGGDATIVPAGDYTLDGRKVACGGVPTVLDPHLNDYAASFPKFIIVRPDLMKKPATAVKLWIYYHECGHVVLGPDTNAADCYGIQRGVREGWLTARAMDQICEFIKPGVADAAHLAGPQRCALMRACFAKAMR